MLYVLAFPVLAPADLDRIEAFRQRHEPQRAALVRAHVTLVFGAIGVAAQRLEAHVRAIAAAAAPFDISLDRIQQHDGLAGARHLFMTMGRGADEVQSLYRALHFGRPELRAREDLFVPHVTIATAATVDAIDAAENEARGLGLPITGRIDELVLASLDGAGLREIALLPMRRAL